MRGIRLGKVFEKVSPNPFKNFPAEKYSLCGADFSVCTQLSQYN
jgi:hypothetical protein